MKVKSESEVAQLYPTLCDPMDCSLPGSSTHGILQAIVLEWGAIAFSIRLWSRAGELQLLSRSFLESVLHNKRSHHNEKPMHHNYRVAPDCHNKRKVPTATKTHYNQK